MFDLTTVAMGPSAMQLLGDPGNDVVRVESPTGDNIRWIGPWRRAGIGPLYLPANRTKRSVGLDLESPDGTAAGITLAARADVLVSNVRPHGR